MTANPLSAIPPMTAPPGPQNSQATRFTPLDPLRVLRQYVKVLVSAFVVGLIVGLSLFFYVRMYAPVYASSAQMAVTIPPRNAWEANDVANTLADARNVSTFIRNQVVVMRSNEVLSNAIKHDSIRNTDWYASFLDSREVIRNLQENLSVGQVPGSTFINIRLSVQGESERNDLPIVLNQIIQTFLLQHRLNSESQTSDVRRLFVGESDRMNDELAQIQEEMTRFTRENQLPTLDASKSEATIEYNKMADRLTDLSLALEVSKENYQELLDEIASGQIKYSNTELLAAENSEKVTNANDIVESMQQRREYLLTKYGRHHREMVSLDDQITVYEQTKARETDKYLRKTHEAKLSSSQKNVEYLESQMAIIMSRFEESRTRVQDVNAKIQEFSSITLRRKAILTRLGKADELLELVRVRGMRPDFERIKLLLDPTVPELTSPMLGAYLVGVPMLFVGAVAMLIFAVETLDQRIKSPSDLRLIPDVEPLGVLPDTSEDPSKPEAIENIVRDDPHGLLAESFRQVRTSVLTRMDRRGYKTLMLVGATGGVGTSSLASNLAISLGFNGRKVLLIDCNFRRPRQHHILNTRSTPGLVDVLTNKASLAQAIHTNDDIEVDLLPNGDGQDAQPEMLEGAAFRNLLSQLESDYDLIIIDAPPALVTSESQLLAKRVDAIAVVVRAMNEKRGMVARMIRMLDGHRADMLGVILNGVRSNAGGYFRQSYRLYYQYRNENEANNYGDGDNGHDRDKNGENSPSTKKSRKTEKSETHA